MRAQTQSPGPNGGVIRSAIGQRCPAFESQPERSRARGRGLSGRRAASEGCSNEQGGDQTRRGGCKRRAALQRLSPGPPIATALSKRGTLHSAAAQQRRGASAALLVSSGQVAGGWADRCASLCAPLSRSSRPLLGAVLKGRVAHAAPFTTVHQRALGAHTSTMHARHSATLDSAGAARSGAAARVRSAAAVQRRSITAHSLRCLSQPRRPRLLFASRIPLIRSALPSSPSSPPSPPRS